MTKEELKEAQTLSGSPESLKLYRLLFLNRQIDIDGRVFTLYEICNDLKVKGYLTSSQFNYWYVKIYPKYINQVQLNLFKQI